MRERKSKNRDRNAPQTKSGPSALYSRVKGILEQARLNAARSVNSSQVIAYWLIGQSIVEEEQRGKRRADYGARLLKNLSEKLQRDFSAGFSYGNLKFIRQFYLVFPKLLADSQIGYALRSQSTLPRKGYAPSSQSFKISPGKLNPDLSWTHYRALLRVEKDEARAFYEIESVKNSWTARELERQINSLLYERLALSKDKKGVLRLSKKGHEIQQPRDVFKDPIVMEFLGVPISRRVLESDIEEALIENLQTFLLELGTGFAFVSRQERLTLDGDTFYIDLVFYHVILRCYIVIEIKTGKLTHQDLGQLQLYVNYFDRERKLPEDNPTLGLLLCTDKNDTVVKYTLGARHNQTIFASRYKLHLPTEAELKAEIVRERRMLELVELKGNTKSK